MNTNVTRPADAVLAFFDVNPGTGSCELIGLGGMNYRMLYFFHGRVAAVLAHGLVKEREVPPREIEEAIRRKRKFELDPKRHTYREG